MYSYRLEYGSIIVQCFPKTNNDLSKEYYIESGQNCRRSKINGTFTFHREDYNRIKAQPFETEFKLHIDRGIEIDYFVGTFYLKDAKTDDEDNLKLEVDLLAYDNYIDLLNCMDSKINLSKDVGNKLKYHAYRTPLIQIYKVGTSELTNFIGGETWVQSCEQIERSDFINTTAVDNTSFNHLTVSQRNWIISHNGIYDISQVWYGQLTTSLNVGLVPNKYISADGIYEMNRIQDVGAETFCWEIKKIGIATIIWRTNTQSEYNNLITSFTFWKLVDGEPTISMIFDEDSLYVTRVLADKSFSGHLHIDNDQIFTQNECYSKIIITHDPNSGDEYNYFTNIEFKSSIDSQTGINPFGLNPNNRYFIKPTKSSDYDWIALNKSSFYFNSVWIRGNQTLYTEMFNRKLSFETRGYELHEVIKGIFKKYNVPLQFSNSSSFSKFFYSSLNPISGFDLSHPVITECSNISINNTDNYTYAINGETTLSEILTYLQKKFKISYAVENGKLILEHEYYFLNNLSYSLDVQPFNIDLSTKLNTRTGKMWDYGTNKLTYEIPETAKYQNIKTQSSCELFGSSEMKLSSSFVNGSNEELLQFTSDYDFIQGSGVSSGLSFACLYKGISQYNTFINNVSKKNTTFYVQNYNLATPNDCVYHVFNKPKPSIIIDNVTYNSLGYFRIKKNQVIIPIGDSFDISPYGLIKTSQGIGFQEKNVVNLSKRYCTIDLLYEL